MYSFIWALLENSLVTSVLFFGVWLIKRMFRLKLSAGMHYLIWGIVVLKLIIPVQFPTVLSPLNLLPQYGAQAEAYLASPETPEELTGEEAVQATILGEAAAHQQQSGSTISKYKKAENTLSSDAAEQNSQSPDWQAIITMVWTAGMAAMAFWLALGIRRLRKNSKNAYPAPEWAARIFDECRVELKIRQNVRLSVENISVPAIRGVFLPVIMLPPFIAENKDEQGLRLILLHEMMHIKRADMAVTYMLNIINVIYCFNPVVWLMARLIFSDMETACDAGVLKVLGASYRQPYIENLVRFSGYRAEKVMQPSLCLSDSGTNMKRRIEGMFLNKKTKRPVKAAVSLLVCMLALICFTGACKPVSGGDIFDASDSKPVAGYAVLEHWTQTIHNDDYGDILIDADVMAPQVTDYTEREIKSARLTQENINKLAKYFAGDNKLYAWPGAYTKEDYDALIAEAAKGSYVDFKYVVTPDSEAYVEQLKSAQLSAPDDSPRKYVEPAFAYITGEDGIVYSEGGKNYLQAGVEYKSGDAMIYACSGAGREDSSFMYALCNGYCTESDYNNYLRHINDEREWGVVGFGDILAGITLDENQAEAQADKALSDLGISNMALVNAEKSVLLPFTYEKVLLGLSNELPARGGYVFTYARNYDGVPGTELVSESYNDNEAPDYTTPYFPETITVAVSENGLEYFRWNGIKQDAGDCESVELRDFSKIKPELISCLIQMKQEFSKERYGEAKITVEVKSAELRMACVKSGDGVLAVPAWVFRTEGTDSVGRLMGTDVFVLNAVDGGVIMIMSE